MAHFAIRKPQWNGGKRCVGLADYKLTLDNTVEVLYTNKHGERTYPQTYTISGEKAKKYPSVKFRADMPSLRMVPIEDLGE